MAVFVVIFCWNFSLLEIGITLVIRTRYYSMRPGLRLSAFGNKIHDIPTHYSQVNFH